jgi:hypothetical protein
MENIPGSSLKNPLESRWLLEPERLQFLRAFHAVANKYGERFFKTNRRTIERLRAEPRGTGRSRPARIESTYNGLLTFQQLLKQASLPLPATVPDTGLLDMRATRLGWNPGTVNEEPGYQYHPTPGMRAIIFEGIDFSGAQLDRAMLAFSVFRNCVLDGACFSHAAVFEFVGCRMTGTDFDEVWSSDLLFDDCQLRSCRLTHFSGGISAAFRTRFHQCDFRKACMLVSYVEDCLFVDCNFANCSWGDARLANNKFENCYFRDPHGDPPPAGALSTPKPPALKPFSRGRAKAPEKKPAAPAVTSNANGFWCLLFRPGGRIAEEVLSEVLARSISVATKAANANELELELEDTDSDESKRFGLCEADGVAALWTLPLEGPRWFDDALELSRRLSGPVLLSMVEDDEAGLLGFLVAEAGEVRRLHWEFLIGESEILDEGAALPSEATTPIKPWHGEEFVSAACKSLGYDLEAMGRGPFRVIEISAVEKKGPLLQRIAAAEGETKRPAASSPGQTAPPPLAVGGSGFLAGIRRLFGV